MKCEYCDEIAAKNKIKPMCVNCGAYDVIVGVNHHLSYEEIYGKKKPKLKK